MEKLLKTSMPCYQEDNVFPQHSNGSKGRVWCLWETHVIERLEKMIIRGPLKMPMQSL